MPGRRLWRAGRRKGIWGARLVRGFVLQHRGKSVLKREDDRGERCQAVGKTTAISVPRVRAHSKRSLEWVVRNRATADECTCQATLVTGGERSAICRAVRRSIRIIGPPQIGQVHDDAGSGEVVGQTGVETGASPSSSSSIVLRN